MFFPTVGIEMNPLLLVMLGLCLGICTGFFGIGGGFMVTPGLNLLGMPMPFAIGTDMTQMAGKAVVSSLKHGRLGNVDLKLGITMTLGTMAGVEVGKRLVMHLEALGNVDVVIRYIYMAILGGLGLYMLRETLKSKVARPEITTVRDVVHSPIVGKIRALKIPPYISLPVSGIPKISVWVIVGVGFITGALAGLLGIGGGFIRMPTLIYLLGVPTIIAVGTDLFEIIISGAYGALTYSMAGRVDMLAAGIMLIAASAGVQIGVLATKRVRGDMLRQFFSYTILAAGISVALKQVASLVPSLSYLSSVATYVLFGAAGGVSLMIATVYFYGLFKARNARQKQYQQEEVSTRQEKVLARQDIEV